jgi:hypothetical protein
MSGFTTPVAAHHSGPLSRPLPALSMASNEPRPMPQMPGCSRVGMTISSFSNTPSLLRSVMAPGMCGQRPSMLARARSWATMCGWSAAKAAAPAAWSQWVWL